MKILLGLFLGMAAGVASADCREIYNAMSQQWEYVCTPDPAEPRLPDCSLHYDAFTGQWIEVCE